MDPISSPYSATWKYQGNYQINWIFSLPVCEVMYGYYREKLLVNHLWEIRGECTWWQWLKVCVGGRRRVTNFGQASGGCLHQGCFKTPTWKSNLFTPKTLIQVNFPHHLQYILMTLLLSLNWYFFFHHFSLWKCSLNSLLVTIESDRMNNLRVVR